MHISFTKVRFSNRQVDRLMHAPAPWCVEDGL